MADDGDHIFCRGLDLGALIGEAFDAAAALRGEGEVASYIPALAEIDPMKLGVAVALGDGRTFVAGDADEQFSIQSISKVFTLTLALARVKGDLWNHVGREPSGSPFNSIVQLEAEKGKPRNPLINAGAIVTCDQLLDSRHPDEALADILDFLRARANDPTIDIDRRVAESEAEAGSLNRSLAWFARSFGNLASPVEDVLSVYFRQCAIAMSCRQLARAALWLAFDGHDPQTGVEIVVSSRSRRVNALMLTCGHYDASGNFAFRIGLPGKSGVGGGIVAIVPRLGTVAVWSPGLDVHGNSLAGAVLLEQLVARTGWSIFA